MSSIGTGKFTRYGDKQIAALLNPFTVHNNSPKWPDGLANYSIGRKHQFTSEIFGPDIVICLFPGSSNWLQAFKWNEDSNWPILLANHGDDRTFQYEYSEQAGGKTIKPAGWLDAGNGENIRFNQWRGVSYALHIDCCNNDEDNDGWFEAIRVSRNSFRHRFGLITATTTGSNNDILYAPWKPYFPHTRIGDGIPSRLTVQEWYSARNWAINPSHATGKIKNLENVMFRLNNESTENEFIKWRPINGLAVALEEGTYHCPVFQSAVNEPLPPQLGTPAYQDSGTYAVPFTELAQATTLGQTDASEVVNTETGEPAAPRQIVDWNNTYISDSFDMILIRIHGMDRTRLVLHSVQNVELQCAERNLFKSFQTVSYEGRDELQQFTDNVQKNKKLPFFSTTKNYANEKIYS